MMRRIASTMLAAVALVTPLAAQRGGGLPMLAPTSSHASGIRSLHLANRQHEFGNTVYLGTPFWGDDYAPLSVETQPVIVVQAPPAQKPPAWDEPKQLPPLVIEWQGDRYVRRTDVNNTTELRRDSTVDAGLIAGTAVHSGTTAPHVELPPTLFVFRDGHREESSDYSIISGVIYARGQYWTNGYWSKQIPLAQLDLPATFKANQERGVNFRLPSAPNEVVTRP